MIATFSSLVDSLAGETQSRGRERNRSDGDPGQSLYGHFGRCGASGRGPSRPAAAEGGADRGSAGGSEGGAAALACCVGALRGGAVAAERGRGVGRGGAGERGL